jgi:hypothetical protein
MILIGLIPPFTVESNFFRFRKNQLKEISFELNKDLYKFDMRKKSPAWEIKYDENLNLQNLQLMGDLLTKEL